LNIQAAILHERTDAKANAGEWADLFSNPEFRDARLSAKGIEQCEEAGTHLNDFEFEHILVSPLRRTIETAYHVLKKHPHFPQMKFHIVPELIEVMVTVAEVPLENTPEVVASFQPQFFNNLGYLNADVERFL